MGHITSIKAYCIISGSSKLSIAVNMFNWMQARLTMLLLHLFLVVSLVLNWSSLHFCLQPDSFGPLVPFAFCLYSGSFLLVKHSHYMCQTLFWHSPDLRFLICHLQVTALTLIVEGKGRFGRGEEPLTCHPPSFFVSQTSLEDTSPVPQSSIVNFSGSIGDKTSLSEHTTQQ